MCVVEDGYTFYNAEKTSKIIRQTSSHLLIAKKGIHFDFVFRSDMYRVYIVLPIIIPIFMNAFTLLCYV